MALHPESKADASNRPRPKRRGIKKASGLN